MKFKKFGNKWVVSINIGEEIVETLKKFCKDNNIKLGTISGIGAVKGATIGFYNLETKKYYPKELDGDYEITSLLGNISTMDGEVYLHLHITLADSTYNAFGGHLNSAVIGGVGEFIIEEIDGEVKRGFNEEVGLNLLFQ
jgi:predicted DNA-binding protein with PD1-like motif